VVRKEVPNQTVGMGLAVLDDCLKPPRVGWRGLKGNTVARERVPASTSLAE